MVVVWVFTVDQCSNCGIIVASQNQLITSFILFFHIFKEVLIDVMTCWAVLVFSYPVVMSNVVSKSYKQKSQCRESLLAVNYYPTAERSSGGSGYIDEGAEKMPAAILAADPYDVGPHLKALFSGPVVVPLENGNGELLGPDNYVCEFAINCLHASPRWTILTIRGATYRLADARPPRLERVPPAA